MIKFQRILVPYDGSTSSQKSLSYAFNLSKMANSEVTVLSCIVEQFTFGFFKTKSDKKIFEKQMTLAEKKLDSIKKEAEKKNIKCKIKIMKSDLISSCIIEYAKKHKMHLIIISKTKVGTYAEKMHRESTTNGVLEHAKCSVLLIR